LSLFFFSPRCADTDIEKSDIFVHCNKRRKVADGDGDANADVSALEFNSSFTVGEKCLTRWYVFFFLRRRGIRVSRRPRRLPR
jgi:hypothetical protein